MSPKHLELPQVIGGDSHTGSVIFPTALRLFFGAKPYTCEGGDPNPLGHAKSMSDVASNSCREERKERKTTPLHSKGSNC